MDERTRKPERERPRLARLFEAAAAAMELTRGKHTLELQFDDGRQVQWFAHAQHRSPYALEDYDDALEPWKLTV
jgi:hypothetical protein